MNNRLIIIQIALLLCVCSCGDSVNGSNPDDNASVVPFDVPEEYTYYVHRECKSPYDPEEMSVEVIQDFLYSSDRVLQKERTYYVSEDQKDTVIQEQSVYSYRNLETVVIEGTLYSGGLKETTVKRYRDGAVADEQQLVSVYDSLGWEALNEEYRNGTLVHSRFTQRGQDEYGPTYARVVRNEDGFLYTQKSKYLSDTVEISITRYSADSITYTKRMMDTGGRVIVTYTGKDSSDFESRTDYFYSKETGKRDSLIVTSDDVVVNRYITIFEGDLIVRHEDHRSDTGIHHKKLRTYDEFDRLETEHLTGSSGERYYWHEYFYE